MKRFLRLMAFSILLLQGCYYYGPAGVYYEPYYPAVGLGYYGSYGYWPYSYYSYRPYYGYPYWQYPHHPWLQRPLQSRPDLGYRHWQENRGEGGRPWGGGFGNLHPRSGGFASPHGGIGHGRGR